LSEEEADMNGEQEMVEVQAMGMAMARPPEVVLAEAHKAAVALQGVIKGKKNPVVFNKEQYIESDDWQLLGRFYGLTAKIVSTTPVDYGGVRGFEARAVVVDVRNGIEVSAAEAMCLNDEEKWSARAKYEWQDELDADGKKVWDAAAKRYKGKRVQVGTVAVPMFQLRSMAQTRACAKALRNVLAWVVVLAGYKPTVAEEMTGDEEPGESKPPITMPARTASPAAAATPPAGDPPPAAAGDGPRKISDAQRKRFYAIWKGAGKTEEQVKAYLADQLGTESSADITVDVYDAACTWAAAK
jgi:hypothetical protein